MKSPKDYSPRDMDAKLALARKQIAQGNHYFGPNANNLVNEFMALEIDDAFEIWILLGKLLPEITGQNCVAVDFLTSEGVSRSKYEAYTFVWQSKKLKKTMLLKFSLQNEMFYYISLRETQEKGPKE